jgi:hypothetical protein
MTLAKISRANSGGSASFHPVIVSPVGQASERHEGVTRALFDKEANVNDIPCLHICPLSQEPPIVGVYFDVPNRNGGINAQVFEKSAVYRWIATAGDGLRSRQNVSHPINQQFVFHPSAWNLVHPVTVDLQELLHQERIALNLAMVDENPLTAIDRYQYEETMRISNDPLVPFLDLICIIVRGYPLRNSFFLFK